MVCLRYLRCHCRPLANHLDRLAPHESVNTDVVLLGHSMGGLVAAEIELLPATAPTPWNTFRHRIIGTINFDVPFLGMHPSVVGTGIGSIFRPAAPPTDISYDSDSAHLSTTSSLTVDSASTIESQRPSRQDTLFSHPTDPNFNPRFTNDVILPMRKGWQNAMHFMNKHSDNIQKATKQLVKSHVEFGGAMADYSSLRLRYMRVRALEDEDTTIRQRLSHLPQIPARVRFVNYYTASTGRKKEIRSRSRSPYGQHLDSTTSLGAGMYNLNLSSQSLNSPSAPLSPRISIEEHIGDSVVHKGHVEKGHDLPTLDEEKLPAESSKEDAQVHGMHDDPSISNIHVQMPNLPPLPPPPTKPPPLDLTVYPDPAAQELIRREHNRQVRAFEQAMQDREAAIQDRKRLEDSLRKLAIQEKTKSREHKAKESIPQASGTSQNPVPATEAESTPKLTSTEPIQSKQADSKGQVFSSIGESSTSPADWSSPTESAPMFSIDKEESRSIAPEATKRKKDRKFCALPKKINGERDPLWIRVYMEGHDEVSAHTGLFYMSETYERLVGDVGAKIEEWVRDDMTRRMIDEYAS